MEETLNQKAPNILTSVEAQLFVANRQVLQNTVKLNLRLVCEPVFAGGIHKRKHAPRIDHHPPA
jgi:hypothetical protein